MQDTAFRLTPAGDQDPAVCVTTQPMDHTVHTCTCLDDVHGLLELQHELAEVAVPLRYPVAQIKRVKCFQKESSVDACSKQNDRPCSPSGKGHRRKADHFW